jgi:multidrug efflux system membrane fusion protein
VKTDRYDHSYASTVAAAATKPKRPQRRWLRGLVGVIVILVAAGIAAFFYAPQYLPAPLAQYSPAADNTPGGRPGGRGGRRAAVRSGDGPVPVLVAAARQADVPIYFDGVGSSKALNTVTVRAQVDGKLMKMNFQEGQDVTQDEVLAEIDPTIYQAQYDQAVAKKAQDEAQLANARLDLDRYLRLSQSNSGTKQQYDTQKALVAQLEAQVQGDQGAIDNAKATLSYTKITAPLAGRTGLRLVDAGNIVHAADTTGIVVITQVKPIAVIFTLPQQQLARVNRVFAKGALSVLALGDDNRTVVDRGTLQVIDNQVDQTTGTVKLKAEFPNTDLQLWPGQFVNVKLLVDTLGGVTVIPSAAVQRGPNGTFVYVAATDDAVMVRAVTVAQQDETEAVVAAGLSPGDRVVTTGFGQLTDGTSINIGEQENFDRPAGSERRRRTPRGGGAVANRTAPAPPTATTAATSTTPAAGATADAQAVSDTTVAPPADAARRPDRAGRPERPDRTRRSAAPQPGDAALTTTPSVAEGQPAGGQAGAPPSPVVAPNTDTAGQPRNGRQRRSQAGGSATTAAQ